MFRGYYEHSIDHKGRVSFPARFRDVLTESYTEAMVLTHFKDSVFCYPREEWEALEGKIAKLSQFQKEVQSFQRYFLSGASEVSIDKQGRILLPQHLREQAGIDKDIVFVGMLKKIEIWSKERWQQVFEESKSQIEDISDVVAGLGI